MCINAGNPASCAPPPRWDDPTSCETPLRQSPAPPPREHQLQAIEAMTRCFVNHRHRAERQGSPRAAG
jgi:hypothetical protein